MKIYTIEVVIYLLCVPCATRKLKMLIICFSIVHLHYPYGTGCNQIINLVSILLLFEVCTRSWRPIMQTAGYHLNNRQHSMLFGFSGTISDSMELNQT